MKLLVFVLERDGLNRKNKIMIQQSDLFYLGFHKFQHPFCKDAYRKQYSPLRDRYINVYNSEYVLVTLSEPNNEVVIGNLQLDRIKQLLDFLSTF